MSLPYGEISLERMARAVEDVRQRLLCASKALEEAGVPYAVTGGNAVAAWVSHVDEAAVRSIDRCWTEPNGSERSAPELQQQLDHLIATPDG